MLGVYSTGNRHVGCVSYWGPPCWVRMEPEVATLLVPEAAMVGVYCTGNRHVGCVLYWELQCWVFIAPEPAMLGVYCTALGAAMLYAPFI